MEMFKIIVGVECYTFNVIRRRLIEEFKKGELDKLLELLRNLDDLYIDYLRKEIEFDKSEVTALREKICEMYREE